MAAAGLGAWGQHAETRDARKFSSRCSPGLVYFNSVASAHVIEVLAPQVPVLTHVHELESYIRAQPSVALLRLLAQTDRFITCSNATRENLTQNHGVVSSGSKPSTNQSRLARLALSELAKKSFGSCTYQMRRCL